MRGPPARHTAPRSRRARPQPRSHPWRPRPVRLEPYVAVRRRFTPFRSSSVCRFLSMLCSCQWVPGLPSHHLFQEAGPRICNRQLCPDNRRRVRVGACDGRRRCSSAQCAFRCGLGLGGHQGSGQAAFWGLDTLLSCGLLHGLCSIIAQACSPFLGCARWQDLRRCQPVEMHIPHEVHPAEVLAC